MTTECDIVRRVLTGDRSAWPELVRRHTTTVWVVARSHRLDRTDAADAVQNTWTALAEHLPRLSSPDRLRAWLVTTARRESLRMRERRRLELPAGGVDETGPAEPHLPRTRDRTLWHAFECLPDRCRTLLALHAHAPELSHCQLARLLELNPGSVARTKSRCLDRLRRLVAETGTSGVTGTAEAGPG